MVFLHPVFTLLFVFMAVSSYLELYVLKKKTPIFLLISAVLLIVFSGFRYFVGADYPIYKNLYSGFSLYTEYSDVWKKATFQPTSEQIEWIYVLLNKILFDMGMPFYMVTFIMVLMSVSLKFTTIYQNLALPVLGAMMYFMPLYFFEDSGQIRQGMGVAICVFSFKYIKERNLPMFILMMYIALGFHKTAVVFFPAYWIVRIPMNSTRILVVIVIAILLSPFEIFRIFGSIVESVGSQDVSDGYAGYVDDSQFGQSVTFGLSDIVKIFFIYVIVRYDKDACKEVYYYEYMRNLAVFGLFLYYIFRGNRIFAIRLPGAYMFFMSVFVVPSIIYAVKFKVQKILYSGFMLYLFLMYFNFSKNNGRAGNFTADRYKNYLWLN
ncbi:polymerase [Cloacibacterium rupense]|uniref:Polymerase n=1 Tax=Cloacibacterium rupense TaxID=517423 RepID=A0ABQ2NK63_9FLAO|nr:EpsG family protein [Cloacibacterium rupense]GGP04110.1 polymerase [Cloacibacterium rupense]